jgi:hypothetical protein
MTFEPEAEDFTFLYYDLYCDSTLEEPKTSILSIYCEVDGKCRQFVNSQKVKVSDETEEIEECKGEFQTANAFVKYLKQLSQAKLLIAIGFNMSVGMDCSLSTVLQMARMKDFDYKFCETHQSNQGCVLRQIASLPNVFFFDA